MLAGTAKVGKPQVRWHAIKIPVLSVSAAKDLIAPPEAVDAVKEIVPHAQVIRLAGGHVGIVAGRSARVLWQPTVDFLAAK